MRKRRLVVALAVSLLMVSCDREPEDPYDRFIYQFEQKADVLLDHLRNADEVMDGESTFFTDGRQASAKVDYYRYKHIAPAAIDLFEHFAKPNMAFYLSLSHAEQLDPDWVNRLKASYERASDELALEVERFRKDMPRRPPTPEQSSELGDSIASAFGPGGIYGASPSARIGTYMYDDDDVLWFYVEGGRIQLDKLLSLDIDDWLSSIRQAPGGG